MGKKADEAFDQIVADLGYRPDVAEELVVLMDLVNELGERWPDDEAPKVVSKLWT